MPDKKITQLPNNYPLTGAELFEIVQAADNKKVDLTTIASFVASTLPGGTYTVDNGLTESPSGNFQLGGILNKSTVIDTQDNPFYIQSYFHNYQTLFLGNYSGTGWALTAQSYNNHAAKFLNYADTDNIIEPVIRIERATSGSPSSGLGASVDYYTQPSIGSIPPGWVQEPDVRTAAVATNTNPAGTRECRYEIWTNNGNVLNKGLTLDHNNQLTLHEYGVGNFVNTPTYSLGVTSTGEVVENENVTVSFKAFFESAQIKSGHTITVLTAPGAGKAWLVLDSNVKYTHGSIAYNNAKIVVQASTAGRPQFESPASILSAAASSAFYTMDKTSAPITTVSQIVENDSIEVTVAPSVTGAGGTITVYGSARLINL